MMNWPSFHPSAGDNMYDWVEVLSKPIWTDAAIRFVTDSAAGGINVFLGTTRQETTSDGKPLIALDYESYAEMALDQMRALARDARTRWPISKLALLHRVGRV